MTELIPPPDQGDLMMYGKSSDGFDDVWIVFEIEDGLLELGPDGVDGLEGVVLEDLLADFVPDIFLRVEFRRVGRKE